jgi:hypothetical protein
MAIFILLLPATDASSAVRLSETPVQNALQAEIARDNLAPVPIRLQAWDDDDFGGSSGRPRSGGKSIFKAALYSTLIPGGGQYYLGKRKTARYFFAAEALTWFGYLSFKTYGNWRRDDYIAFAAVNANADLEDKSDEHLAWVGFYNNIREFNSFGRVWDPERAYLPDTPENHWEWKSDDERQTYRDLRNRSLEAFRRSDFMIGVAILDRVVSVIDAVRSARRMNRRIDMDLSDAGQNRWLKLSVNPFSSRRQVCLTLYPGF